MKKYAVLILLLASCSSAPKGFCECLEKGEKLNEVANKMLKVLQKERSQKESKELLQARKEKDAACANFKNQTGKEMLEWKKDCKSE